MKVRFRATDARFESENDALVCGVSGGDDYLIFQAGSGMPDERIYLEHRDQINGDYGCIRTCRLSRTQLSVDLKRQLGKLTGVDGFEIALAIDDASYSMLHDGLHVIFRGQPDGLVVA